MNAIPKPPVRPLFQAEYGHFIGGEWVSGSSGKKISLQNPADQSHLAYIQAGSAADADRAVDAAAEAFKSYAQSPAHERQAMLYEIAQRLRRRIDDFAMLETLNNGKPITEAKYFDLPTVIDQFLLFSGAPWDLHGRTIDHANAVGIVHREPLGVVAQIIPWNVPLIMLAGKLAPALAAGCTVVLKPSEVVCLSVLEFMREMSDIIPPGVVNILTGYGTDVGEALVTNPKVRKVAFTGSRPTAQKLLQYASTNIIPQTMELGGKSAYVVCADADIDAAAEGAALSVIINKGEVCLAGSRVFVHEKVHDQFLNKLTSILESVRIGNPTEPETQLGALASKPQLEKVLGYLDLGVSEGATVATGGKRVAGGLHDKGFYVEPTIFTNVDNRMRIAQEEIFGPVSTVMTWSDEAEMLERVNDTVYGLGGGVWTRDLTQAHRIARRMQTGTVWVNRYYNFMTGMPLGGYKQSGFGREFCHEVLEHYTQTKSVIINLEAGPIGAFAKRT